MTDAADSVRSTRSILHHEVDRYCDNAAEEGAAVLGALLAIVYAGGKHPSPGVGVVVVDHGNNGLILLGAAQTVSDEVVQRIRSFKREEHVLDDEDPQ